MPSIPSSPDWPTTIPASSTEPPYPMLRSSRTTSRSKKAGGCLAISERSSSASAWLIWRKARSKISCGDCPSAFAGGSAFDGAESARMNCRKESNCSRKALSMLGGLDSRTRFPSSVSCKIPRLGLVNSPAFFR